MENSNFSLIIGLGKTGFSCAEFLSRQGKNFSVMDSRENPPDLEKFKALYPDVKIYLGDFDQIPQKNIIQQADEIIASPGISPEYLPLKKTISDIALFARYAQAPMIGITGTNAKGTVVTLLARMIEQAGFSVLVGGNIGTPALDLLAKQKPDFYVLEISSFQLELINILNLKAAVILNLSPDHLDRHQNLENYYSIKQRIYKHAENIIFNREDIYTSPIQARSNQNLMSFGLDNPIDKNQFGLRGLQLAYAQQDLISVQEIKLQGKHNWSNILAALALGQSIGLPMQSMREALKNFPGLPHRCEHVAFSQGISWINDSKGTNIGATRAALEGLGENLSGKIILIAGGLSKGADFSLLKKAVENYVKHVILLGQDAPVIANTLLECKDINIQIVATLQEAVSAANSFASAGDSVLLSPACASFDMFKNFEDRGEQFKKHVLELISHE